MSEEIIQNVLNAHNQYRAQHGAGPLQYSEEISQIAQEYAEKLAREDSLEHSSNTYQGEPLGENLAFWNFGEESTDGLKAVEMWYSEIKDYDFGLNDYQPGAGHFSQVVWKGSRYFGFGVAKSSDGSFYAVGNYFPAGNVLGNFEENVSPAN